MFRVPLERGRMEETGMTKQSEMEVCTFEPKVQSVEQVWERGRITAQVYEADAKRLGAFFKEHPTAWRTLLDQMARALVYARDEVPEKFPESDKRTMADHEASLALAELMEGLVQLRRGHMFDATGTLDYAGRKAKNASNLVFNFSTEQTISKMKFGDDEHRVGGPGLPDSDVEPLEEE